MDELRVALPGRPTLHCLSWPSSQAGRADVPTYLLVHGLSSNARMWLGVGDLLAAGGARVVAVDLRGHGPSDKPDEGYDIPSVAADLVALISALDLRVPVVAGQSWGGNVVVELAAAHPGTVGGLVCVDGGWIRLRPTFPDFDECWAQMAPPRFGPMQYDDLAASVAANRDWPATGVAGVLGCFERLPDGSARPWLTRERHRLVLHGLWEHDPFAATIATPTLLIPTLRNAAAARQLAAGIDGARVEPIDGHHDLHAEQPEVIARLIASV